jgi:ketosteroid isomerase-like protein
MSEPTTREVIDRYVKAMQERDLDALQQILREDYVEEYPQSGERIRGMADARAMLANYPGGEPQPGKVDRIVGTEDRWVMTPSYTPMRVEGTGDQYTIVAHIHYPDGSEWHEVQLIQLKDGRIARNTAYFAAPFEAPAWREPYVERYDPD